MGLTEPKKDSAIFTTYGSSKGLKRKIAVTLIIQKARKG